MKYRIIVSVIFVIIMLAILEIKTDEPAVGEDGSPAPVNAEQPAPSSSPNFNL